MVCQPGGVNVPTPQVVGAEAGQLHTPFPPHLPGGGGPHLHRGGVAEARDAVLRKGQGGRTRPQPPHRRGPAQTGITNTDWHYKQRLALQTQTGITNKTVLWQILRRYILPVWVVV